MSTEGIARLRAQQEKAETAAQGDLAQLTMLQAVKTMTDALERVVAHQERSDENLKSVADTLHAFDKRLVVMETGETQRRIEALESALAKLQADQDTRFKPLELAEHGRKIERSVASTILSSPLLGWLFAAAAVAIGWVQAKGGK